MHTLAVPDVFLDTTPLPTVVSFTSIKSPKFNPDPSPFSYSLNPSSLFVVNTISVPPVPTAIPVILAVNPVIKPTLPVLSLSTTGGCTRTLGAIVYPKPGLVIANPSIAPPLTVTVAVAVVATATEPSAFMKVPTPTDGDEIDTDGALV